MQRLRLWQRLRRSEVMARFSILAVIGGLTAFGLMALAAIILVADTPDSMNRLALFFALTSTVIAALIGAMRSDQAAKQTNGTLDDRIESAVLRAQATRRRAFGENDQPGD